MGWGWGSGHEGAVVPLITEARPIPLGVWWVSALEAH